MSLSWKLSKIDFHGIRHINALSYHLEIMCIKYFVSQESIIMQNESNHILKILLQK